MKTRTKGNVLDFLMNHIVVFVILLVCIYTSIMNPDFLKGSNLLNILRQASGLGVISVGMTIVIIGGFTDLSIPGLLSLEGMVLAVCIGKMNAWLAIGLTIAVGIIGGILNGSLVIGFGAETSSDALFITYGMSMFYFAVTCLINTNVISLGDNYPVLNFFGRDSIGFIPVIVLIFFLVVIIFHFILTKTPAGKSIFLIGGNREAARLSGINKNFYTVLMFTIMGLLTAIGAIMIASRTASVNTGLGKGYDTSAITATVIGGTALSGGRGGAVNTLFGALLIQLLSNAMNMLGFDSNIQFTVKGLILVLVIMMDSLRAKRGAVN